LFQALDDKDFCIGVYKDGEFFYDSLPDNLSRTWKYSEFLKDRNVEYASLYCEGKTLDEICPEHLRAEWTPVKNKLRAFLTSIRISKVSLNDNCLFELLPQSFLVKYCEIKNKISLFVFENFEKPKNYDFFLDLTKVITELKHRELNINLKNLEKFTGDKNVRNYIKKMTKINPHVSYNIFKSRTGRLVTEPNSFPILTLNKICRNSLEPHNDFFVEFDFNAAELRTILALQGQEQPGEDLHDWNVENVYRGLLTRDEAKKRIFAWLYNPDSKDFLSNRIYKRDEVVNKYYDGHNVSTVFDRKIQSDQYHALNYIVQSTTSDMFLKQMIKINKMLEKRKSFVSFSMHDSLVIDFSVEDKDIFKDIFNEFSDTALGRYKTNVSIGKTFGNMEQIKL
jgi:hypothetical protein